MTDQQPQDFQLTDAQAEKLAALDDKRKLSLQEADDLLRQAIEGKTLIDDAYVEAVENHREQKYAIDRLYFKDRTRLLEDFVEESRS